MSSITTQRAINTRYHQAERGSGFDVEHPCCIFLTQRSCCLPRKTTNRAQERNKFLSLTKVQALHSVHVRRVSQEHPLSGVGTELALEALLPWRWVDFWKNKNELCHHEWHCWSSVPLQGVHCVPSSYPSNVNTTGRFLLHLTTYWKPYYWIDIWPMYFCYS